MPLVYKKKFKVYLSILLENLHTRSEFKSLRGIIKKVKLITVNQLDATSFKMHREHILCVFFFLLKRHFGVKG